MNAFDETIKAMQESPVGEVRTVVIDDYWLLAAPRKDLLGIRDAWVALENDPQVLTNIEPVFNGQRYMWMRMTPEQARARRPQ